MNPQWASDEYRRSRGLPLISPEQKTRNFKESRARHRKRLLALQSEARICPGDLVCPQCNRSWPIFEGCCEHCPGNPKGIPMGERQRRLRQRALRKILAGTYERSEIEEIDELKEIIGFADAYGCRHLLELGRLVARTALKRVNMGDGA